MRGRPALLVAATLLAGWTLTGCGALTGGDTASDSSRTTADESNPGPEQGQPGTPSQPAPTTPVPEPTRSVPPAATAGGACALLSYDAVAAATGVRFDVAASTGTAGREQVCVLQRMEQGLPDLTLTVLPTTADTESFTLDFQPKGATKVSGLGRAAYSQVTAASQVGRPTAEVGWLGKKKKLYTLTYSGGPSTSPAALAKAAAGLVKLAKTLPA